MKWITVGMKPQFVEEVKTWFSENEIQYSEDILNIDDISYILYRPIGKKQIEKCIKYITDRCNNNLM